MTSEAEQRDLDEMKVELARVRENFFSKVRDIMRMDDAGSALKEMDKIIAIIGNARYALKEMNKITAKFLKKWPD